MVRVGLSPESLAILKQVSADLEQSVDESARVLLESALVMLSSRE